MSLLCAECGYSDAHYLQRRGVPGKRRRLGQTARSLNVRVFGPQLIAPPAPQACWGCALTAPEMFTAGRSSAYAQPLDHTQFAVVNSGGRASHSLRSDTTAASQYLWFLVVYLLFTLVYIMIAIAVRSFTPDPCLLCVDWVAPPNSGNPSPGFYSMQDIENYCEKEDSDGNCEDSSVEWAMSVLFVYQGISMLTLWAAWSFHQAHHSPTPAILPIPMVTVSPGVSREREFCQWRISDNGFGRRNP